MKTFIVNFVFRSYLLLSAALLIFIAGGCHDTDRHKIIYSNDLEEMEYWKCDTKVIKAEAHSGRYVTYADSANEYSFGFSAPIKKVSYQRIWHINATIAVKFSSLNNKSYLVISIDSAGTNKLYKATQMEPFTDRTDVWVQVKATADVPASIKPDDQVTVYVWNKGKQVLLDDCRIEFVPTP